MRMDHPVVVVVTCEERGTPYWLLGAGRRVWPEWKVDLTRESYYRWLDRGQNTMLTSKVGERWVGIVTSREPVAGKLQDLGWLLETLQTSSG